MSIASIANTQRAEQWRERIAQQAGSGLSVAAFCQEQGIATQSKILYFDRSGGCEWAKRIEPGRFLSDWKQIVTREIDVTQL